MFNERFGKKLSFNFNSDNLPFISLDEYVAKYGNKQFTVKAVFVHTKGKKKYPAVVSNDYKIWLPSHLTKTVDEIANDSELVTAINNGRCGFVPRQYEKVDEYAGTYNTGDFIDI